MVKFILGLVTGVILVFLSFVLLFFVLLRFREKPPEIGANSVLVLRLAGEIPEKAPLELPDFLGGGKAPLTVVNIYSLLRKAAADSNIRAMVIQPDSISAGWAKLEEIRSDLEQFHKSGKPDLRLSSPAHDTRILRLAARRSNLSRRSRTGLCQRPARRNHVLQEDAG